MSRKPEQRHVQRTWNRRGAHRQHVDVVLQLLQPLFVAHSEALLFVNDQQAEIVELHVLRKQPMRADEHIDFAGGEIFEQRL